MHTAWVARGPPPLPMLRPHSHVFLCASDASEAVASTAATEMLTSEVMPTPDVSGAAAAAAAALAACEWDGWDERATWALEDSVPRYSLDGGKVVLWRRLSIEVPELLTFTPAELKARWLAIAGSGGAATAAAAVAAQEEPPCLEDWVCVGPGRYEGSVYNLPSIRDGSLRATIEHDVEAEIAAMGAPPPSVADAGTAGAGAASAPASAECSAESLDGTRRWVRTRQGALFQLGLPRAESESAEAAEGVMGMLSNIDGDEAKGALADGAGAVVGAAKGVTSAITPGLLTGGLILTASAIGYMVLGHHHVDVSVFIV